MPPRRLLAALLLAGLASPCRAASLDYFLGGAGAALYPLDAAPLVLLQARLRLFPIEDGPCFEVKAPGKATPADGLVEVGGPVDCDPEAEQAFLRPLWRAESSYSFEASTSAVVSFAVPLRTWKPFEDSALEAPGEANVSADLDGVQMRGGLNAWISKTQSLFPSPDEASKRTLGSVWTAEVSPGTHTVHLVYDFDVEYYSRQVPALTFPAKAEPWFLKRQEGSGEAYGGVRRLRFSLAPLTRWSGGGPLTAELTLRLPPGLSETLAVPLTLGPRCLDRGRMDFEVPRQLYGRELIVAYPKDPSLLPAFAEPKDLEAWRASIGPDAALTCGLLSKLGRKAAAGLKTRLAAEACRDACSKE